MKSLVTARISGRSTECVAWLKVSFNGTGKLKS